MVYVEVILPLRLSWLPVYKTDLPVAEGTRVNVEFAHREYAGVVYRLVANPAVSEDKLLSIREISKDTIPVTTEELLFWSFLSKYYLCSIGEVFKAAYPAQRIRSEAVAAAAVTRTMAMHARRRDAEIQMLSKRKERLSSRLQAKEKAMAERGIKAGAMESGRPDETVRKLSPEVDRRLQAERNRILAELEALEARLHALETSAPVPQSSCEPYGHTAFPAPGKPVTVISPDRASDYLGYAEDTLARGGQVLVLFPEKAFMEAMLPCFSEAFAELAMPYSSDFSPAARRKVSEALRRGPAVVLGTRASIYLPFANLQTVIIDEEQDTFHKQTEPAPRINARDAAIALAGIHGAQVVLGTICPSLETYANCLWGKYAMAGSRDNVCEGTPEIFNGHVKPSNNAEIVDLAGERRKNGVVGVYSRRLLRRIASAGGPVLLLRGWEKDEEIFADGILPDGVEVRVMTLSRLKREGAGGAALIALLQADAFVSREDFRADERALQLVGQLSCLAPSLVVQTSLPERFDGGRDLNCLLSERKVFNYPPYSRMIDVLVSDNSPKRLANMSSQLSGLLGASAETLSEVEVRIRVCIPRNADFRAKKSDLARAVMDFETVHKYQGHLTIDVDPC